MVEHGSEERKCCLLLFLPSQTNLPPEATGALRGFRAYEPEARVGLDNVRILHNIQCLSCFGQWLMDQHSLLEAPSAGPENATREIVALREGRAMFWTERKGARRQRNIAAIVAMIAIAWALSSTFSQCGAMVGVRTVSASCSGNTSDYHETSARLGGHAP
jgi:hypothetical protein